MAWIESHQELPRHPKVRKAAKRLDISHVQLVGHLHFLWWWALEQADDGNLSKFDTEDIAIGAEWDGDPDEFVEALAGCGSAGGPGFLERGGSYGNPDDGKVGELVLYGWWGRAGKLVAKRRKDAARKRRDRASNTPDVQGMSNGRPADGSADVQPGRTDGAAHTTQPDRTQENQPLGDDADAPRLDVGAPLRKAPGETYSRTLGGWALNHGYEPPDSTKRSDKYRWLLSVVTAEFPMGNAKQDQQARGRAGEVIRDYLHAVTGEPLPGPGHSYLARQVAEGGWDDVFESVVVAVESGAGLSDEYQGDPLALLKYAMAVRNGKGRAA